MFAFFTNAMAWEPVIKERHWFGTKEFEAELYPDPGVGPCQGTVNCVNNELMSITLHRDWSGGPTAASSFNCWMDDSETTPKPRFKFNADYNWEVGTNNNPNYTGYGLKVKDLGGNGDGGTIIHIQHLNNGDKLVFEMYCQPGNIYMPFLEAGSIDGVPALNYATDWSWDGANNIGNPDGVSNEYTYTGSDDGTISIKMPSNAVIRCITIIYNDANYQKATTKITEIREDIDGDNKTELGYEMTITGSGVLEDKRGAVPYLTMRYGAMNDMTFSKYLGTVNGEKQYGTFSIVDETDPLVNSNDVQLQTPYRQRSETQNKKSLVGKEITVFTENEDLSDQPEHEGEESPRFNSIYPLYGNYFYFFPEVDGKFHVKFYCEGDAEMMCMWYKLDNGVPVPIAQQNLSKLMMSTDGGNSWTGPHFGGGNSTLNQNYYEYTAEFKKGGVYYLCSNPTIHGQQSPIPRLISYSFIPKFRVDPLYNVVDNGTTACGGVNDIEKMAQIYGGVFPDLGVISLENPTPVTYETMQEGVAYPIPQNTITINDEPAPRVKFLGNVDTATPYVYVKNGTQYLGFKDITYKYKDGDDTSKPINEGGAIVVNMECSAGKATFVLTIAYKAAEAEWGKDAEGNPARMGSNDQDAFVKRWDFFSGKGDGTDGGWDLGKYSNESSKLYKETHKADGLTADWMNTYVNLKDEEEPIFKSVYDMEGDNADMIHETAGLLFLTETNLLGIYNEKAASTASQFNDRYIGLMGPSELDLEDHPRALIIPKLTEGDRIVIKMGTYGNCNDDWERQNAILKITGAYDAKGKKEITEDYIIGGSGVDGNGEVEDMSQPHGEYHFVSKGGDFKLEVKEADLLKIYSIDIYKNTEILTENQLKGLKPEVTFTDEDAEDAEETIDAHVRYHGFEEISTFDDIDQLRGNLSFAKDDFDVTESDTEPYCTISTTVKKGDFGSVRAKMEVLTKDNNNTYVTDYVPGTLAVGLLEKVKDGYPYTWDFTDLLKITDGNDTYIYDAIDFEKGATNLLPDYKGWEAYNGQSLRNAPKNASGVLFADGGQLYAKNQMFAEVAGIGFKRSTETIEDAKTLNRSVRIRDNALVLNCNEEGIFHKMVIPKVDADAVIYVRATPIENAKFKALCSKDGTNGAAFDKTLTVGDDKVFIMKNDAKQDVELWLNGYEIHKISVSRDPKKIGSTGYATESRDHVIDHTLTEYFTGLPIKAYQAELSTDRTKVTLSEIEFLKAATAEGDKTGCVLYNKNGGAVNIIDNGFHLFVPDMHDKGTTAITNNVLKAYLDDSQGNVKSEGDVTSFVLSAKVYDRSSVGLDTHTYLEGKTIGFYKVDPVKGAKLASNSAYLQLGSTSQARVLIFFGDVFGEIPTSIETVEPADEEKAVWHNLNGQVINAPEKAGIYIRNGKKVVVK